PERTHDIVPAHARERDLQHGDEGRKRSPAKIQQRDRGRNLAPIDLPRDIPKARPGYEQLGCDDCGLFGSAAMRRPRRVKITSHTGAHSPSSLTCATAATSCPGSSDKRRCGMVMAETNAKFKR